MHSEIKEETSHGKLEKFAPPTEGEKITIDNGKLKVPNNPIIPFIEGDGTGRDIWRASKRVLDAAVEKAYKGEKKIAWYEVYAGEKAYQQIRRMAAERHAGQRSANISWRIKGPLTTPVGGGIRSLNVALRQELDLYVCLRPVRYFKGVPSPVKRPELVEHGHFPREHGRHLCGHRIGKQAREEVKKVIKFLQKEMGVNKDPLPGDERHRHQAGFFRRLEASRARRHRIRDQAQPQIRDPRAQGQHHEVHRRRVQKLGLRSWLNRNSPIKTFTWGQYDRIKEAEGAEAANKAQKEAEAAGKIIIKDAIADIALQQVLTRPAEFDVIATLNLNGDYLSDALAAQVGGIGIAPGANINYVTGHAIFEATHGTAPKYADKDVVNPGSVILSGVMMLEHMGWQEAADLIIQRDGNGHQQQNRHLRLRPPDGRRDRSQMLGVRRRNHQEHVRTCLPSVWYT